MIRKYGGPAFPGYETVQVGGDISGYVTQHRPVTGMTLRDYFAAKAMQAMLHERQGPREEGLWLVTAAYAWADAMLAERVKPEA